MRRDEWIGFRVARWRDIAGLTQAQLADQIGISREYLSRLENGRRPVTSRQMLVAMAAALGVSVGDLIDQPTPPRTQHDMHVYAGVPALRAALDDDSPEDGPVDVAQLSADVDRAMAARAACDYVAMARMLPPLVAASRRLANEGSGADAELGLALFVRAAVTAASPLKSFGHIDLATRLCERAELAADRLGRPAEQAAVAYTLAQCALASGSAGGQRRSLTYAAGAADTLDISDDEQRGWYVMLHLHAGLSAAVLGDGDQAAAHHGEAAAVAEHVIADPWRAEPTPANVGVWRVAIALEHDPGKAAQYARAVDRSALQTRIRQSHLHIHAGRGSYLAGDVHAAVQHFLAADEIAPSELRHRPSVHELVGQMVRDAHRRGSSELRDLASRVGIDPLVPESGPRPGLM